MRVARGALATVLVLSGFRTVWAEPCAPRAMLDGDGTAVERVAEELRRLGVTVSRTSDAGVATNGCSIVRAQVELEPSGGIAVAVHGATRGSEGRVVSDAALAAAWIDSWTRDDVDNALWAAPPRTPSIRVAAADPPVVTPRDVAPTITTPATASRWDRVVVSANYEQQWSDDDASWTGASAALCVRVGAFCIGGRARLAFDPERLHEATGVARDDSALLATVSQPISAGTMSIAPELGVGVGRLATRRAESECKPVMSPPTNCDPMTDPMCVPAPAMCEPLDPGTTTPKIYVGDDFSAATYAPRLAVALRIAVPLFQHVWLDGLAGVTFSPFSHGAAFAASANANTMSPDPTALPGEPGSGYVLGIGLRVGAR